MGNVDAGADEDGSGITRYRWWICALLFFGTTICYLDRQVIAVLKNSLKSDLHMDEQQYAAIVAWFQTAYAAGYLLAGRMNDILRVRRGYAVSVFVWSLAAMAHALVRTVGGFSFARAALGLAEGGNFPASVRSVSEWFPRKERALATGIFNAGSNVGVMVSAVMVPWITLRFGWPAAFLGTGMIGLVWLIPWLAMYRPPEEHPRVSASELRLIQSDPPDTSEKISWASLLKYRATWAFAVGMALSGPIWWFYLFWVPGFLYDQFGVDLKNIGLPLITVYLIADVGSVAGGWFSSWLIKRGRTVNFSRKLALLVCALCVVPVVMASRVSNQWVAVCLIGLAAAAHQGWSANLYTFVSDTIPRKAVGSVVGMGGMAGAVAGIFFSVFVGAVLKWTHNNYLIIFLIAPTAYLVALAAIQFLVPKIEDPSGSNS
ncbi:MAG: MFS transporter [Fimbriimonas sp.]|nr:MFS transporter [Fimbriimonas sp.]